MAVPSLIFITGGVRSGKSSFAEKMAVDLAMNTGGQLNYLATGVAFDQEMRERIAKHQQDRAAGESSWRTIERSLHIVGITNMFGSEDIILLDCVTTLLNNELFSVNHQWDEPFLNAVKDKIVNGIIEIQNQGKVLIVVSNEVFHEPLIDNELVFTYRKLLGQIHQQLVKTADQAYLVEMGVPILMKGARS
ncbi:bifunctional adenosylcobinamide kinase/adenosylcobinamide-phosphate guanylyltransferase [Neobacillus niacini]|uniref:bifunctional adenosylcobinamide kinase/adenosylcobinamide-phosphate guanylyltransferase n=1 Tax=Neobacillus niacini TaxID=86668 RepID=UPI002FFF9EE0